MGIAQLAYQLLLIAGERDKYGICKQLAHTEVVLTPQSSAAGTGVGAGGVSMNSNDSSEGAFERSDMVN